MDVWPGNPLGDFAVPMELGNKEEGIMQALTKLEYGLFHCFVFLV